MPRTKSHVFPITVSYSSTAEKFTLTGSNVNNGVIHIPLGTQMVYFKLKKKSAPASPAYFPTWPIQWFDGSNKPVAQPTITLVQWFNATRCQMVIFNAVGFSRQTDLKFSMAVVSGTQVYITDPTIICDPPMQ